MNNILVPPIYLVSRSIAHLEVSHTSGTLVVLRWRSASFWPYLFPSGTPRKSIQRIVEFSDPSGIFDSSHLNFPTIFDACRFRAPVLVIHLDASFS